MHETLLKPGLDTLLLGVPLVCLLLTGYFRLDQIVAAPKRTKRPKPAFLLDKGGRALMTDPDGRPWGTPIPPR
jgi:hypothetical protein